MLAADAAAAARGPPEVLLLLLLPVAVTFRNCLAAAALEVEPYFVPRRPPAPLPRTADSEEEREQNGRGWSECGEVGLLQIY